MKLLMICALTALTFACSQTAIEPASPSGTSATGAVEVRKSPNDDRQYQFLVLPNKLRVLLVSDATTDKAAAALAVYRGSFHEPQDRPGLAHFLEHMLFIQTETYPEVDGFMEFVSSNGGSTNAYTALELTNYFFDIKPEALQPALDRFARFFIDPIISADYASREKNAVHSEYQMQLKQDGWRGYMASKQAINPAHPGSKFTIGSLDTLAGDIQDDLIAFFESQYSADQMGLVVLSAESLPEMASWVTPLFSQIANKNIGPDHPNVPVYTDDQLPALLEVQSLEEGASVSYNFQLPATAIHYKTKPEQYFANLIGHEGEGSLHEFLTAKGWIESLSAGVGDFDRHHSIFSVNIDLTPAGQQNLPAITDALFDYIDLIKSQPPKRWLYNEQAKVAELGFKFQEKTRPMGFVYQMAPKIDEVPPKDLLVSNYLMEDFDRRLIQQYMALLNEDNVLIEYSAPDVQGEATEPWFQVPYTLVKQKPARIPTATTSLSFPKPNPFLPENLTLVPSDSAGPQKYIDQPGLELWLDTDTEFGTPRANLFIELAVEGGLVSVVDRAKAQLYRMIVEDALSQFTYPAYLAGMGYSIAVPDSGYEVRIGGYDDKQLAMLEAVLTGLLETKINADRFAALKASLIQDWNNAAKERPFRQAFAALDDTLRSGRWPREQLAQALAAVSLGEIEIWRKQKLSRLHARVLLHGNETESDAKKVAAALKNNLKLADLTVVTPQVREIDSLLRLQLPVVHDDSSMVLHVQDPDDGFASRAMSSLAAQFLHNGYFRELRTEQQFGYVVSVTNRPVVNRGGVSFIIQSPVKSAAALENATLEFVNHFVNEWENVSAEEFQQQQAGVISRLLQAPKNLNERSQKFWSDLIDNHLTFDSRQQIAAEVGKLTRVDMIQFLNRLQRKLTSQRLLIFTQGKFDDVPQLGTLLPDATAGWNAPAG